MPQGMMPQGTSTPMETMMPQGGITPEEGMMPKNNYPTPIPPTSMGVQ
jgi:hypothetical protein